MFRRSSSDGNLCWPRARLRSVFRAPMEARVWILNVRLRLSKVWFHEFRAIDSANWRLVPFGFMVASARSYYGQANRHPKHLGFVLVGLEHGPQICCLISSLLICMMIGGVSTIDLLPSESQSQVLSSQVAPRRMVSYSQT
jgi:hypothetical protein